MFECLVSLVGPVSSESSYELNLEKFVLWSHCGASAEVTGADVIMVFTPHPKYPRSYFPISTGNFFSLKMIFSKGCFSQALRGGHQAEQACWGSWMCGLCEQPPQLLSLQRQHSLIKSVMADQSWHSGQ